MNEQFALVAATEAFNSGLRGHDAITAIVKAYGELNPRVTIDAFFAAVNAVRIIETGARAALYAYRDKIDEHLARLSA